jgi:hypothetical protein
MQMFGILEPFFRALSDGKIIRLTVAWVLRIMAVVGALGGLFWFITFVGLGFKASDAGLGARSTGFLAGCLIFSLFGLAFGYLWIGICMFRARTVMALGDSHFTVLSILSILFRLNGELTFVTYSLIGVGGCLFVWLSDVSPLSELGPLGSQLPFAMGATSGFVGGIELAVFMILLAFAGIVIFYALAELSIVLVEIALNTRGIPAIAGAALPAPQVFVPVTPAPAPVQPFAAPAPVVAQRSSCRQCGQVLDAGSAFCAECGAAAG